MLRIKLFGAPQIYLHDHLLSTTLVGKGLALFAYLITSLEPRPRGIVADLLWTDLSEQNAKMNLRGLLYDLRQLLGEYLIVTRQTVAFNRQLPYWLDVEIFVQTVGRQEKIEPLLLTEGLSLYRHDFLDGLYLTNASAFDSWLWKQRQQFHSWAVAGWRQLVKSASTEKNLEKATHANQSLLDLEPWNEEAHRQQMQMLAASGQYQAALTQYERCCQILREEVDAPPSVETTALYEQIKAQLGSNAMPATTGAVAPPASSPLPLRLDWGAMPLVQQFCGRQQELSLLHHWLVTERSRVVALVGINGQGKSALAAHFLQTVVALPTPAFEGIIWRSLQQAPPLTTILQDWIYQLSDQQVVDLPPTLDRQFALLADYLQRRRFLFVLDDVEPLMAATAADKVEEQAAYLKLWQLFSERNHQSSLLVTASALAPAFHRQLEQPGIFRRLVLEGLIEAESKQLLKRYGLHGSHTAFSALQQRYSGNPLALIFIAQAIDELFAGDINAFLQEKILFFGDIEMVLDQQFVRLSSLEQAIITWLALEQAPVTSEQLWHNLTPLPPKRDYLAALRTLLHRSLIQQQDSCFVAQAFIVEYARHRLLEALYQELTVDNVSLPEVARLDFTHNSAEVLGNRLAASTLGNAVSSTIGPFVPAVTYQPVLDAPPPDGYPLQARPLTLSSLNYYALRKAQTPDQVADEQTQLLLAPLLQRLLSYWGRDGLEKLVRRLLSTLRAERYAGAPLTDGYAAANLFHLLRQVDPRMEGYDFSHLTLRQATLRNTSLHEVNLTGATLQECAFTNTFAAVTALAFHPAGKWLAVGTQDGDLGLWQLGDEQMADRLAGHPAPITALAVSPDGRWLASSSLDDQIYLWDVEAQTICYVWPQDGYAVGGLAFSLDGQWLAVPGSRGINLYSVTTGALAYTLPSPSQQLHTVAFAPTGHWLVGGGLDGQLHFWTLDAVATATAPQQILLGHADAVLALCVSHDGRTLYSGGRDHLIQQWDVAGLASGRPCPAQPMHTLCGHQRPISGLALAPLGQWLASSSADGTVRLWDAYSGELRETLSGHRLGVRAVAFQPPSSRNLPQRTQPLLVSAGDDQQLITWEIGQTRPGTGPHASVRPRYQHQGYSAALHGIQFTPDGQFVVSAGLDPQIRVWDIKQNMTPTTLYHSPSWIMSLVVNPHRHQVAWSDHEGQVWQSALPLTAHRAAAYQEHFKQSSRMLTGHQLTIDTLAFHPTGQLLAGGGPARQLYLWDAVTGDLRQTLSGHTDVLRAVAFSPDGQLLASASRDQRVRLWRLPEQWEAEHAAHAVATLSGHRAAVQAVAFTPDSAMLVSGSYDQTIRIWDRQGSPQRVITGHRAGIVALAVSPTLVQGRLTFASCDQQQQVRIWDLACAETIHCWDEPAGKITQLQYSPDGKTLIGANRDGYLRLWDVQSGLVIQTFALPKPYSNTNIAEVMGITAAQKQALRTLGAVE